MNRRADQCICLITSLVKPSLPGLVEILSEALARNKVDMLRMGVGLVSLNSFFIGDDGESFTVGDIVWVAVFFVSPMLLDCLSKDHGSVENPLQFNCCADYGLVFFPTSKVRRVARYFFFSLLRFRMHSIIFLSQRTPYFDFII